MKESEKVDFTREQLLAVVKEAMRMIETDLNDCGGELTGWERETMRRDIRYEVMNGVYATIMALAEDWTLTAMELSRVEKQVNLWD